MADGSDFTLFPITNARGDVVEVRLRNGGLYARYIYDSWGNIVSVRNPNGYEITDPNHYANQNPFRYRGYYYDAESGLYYLQSRYYDPVTGRFVNADSQLNTDNILGFNTFAYCYNNPVTYSDSEGNRPIVGAGPISKETAKEKGQSVTAMNPKIEVAKNLKQLEKAKDPFDMAKEVVNLVSNSLYIEVGFGVGKGSSGKIDGVLGYDARASFDLLEMKVTSSQIQYSSTLYVGAVISYAGFEYGIEFHNKFNWQTHKIEPIYNNIVCRPDMEPGLELAYYNGAGVRVGAYVNLNPVGNYIIEILP